MENHAYFLLAHGQRPGHEALPAWKRLRPSPRLIHLQAWSFSGIAATCGIIITLIFSHPSSHFFRLTSPQQPQCSIPGVGINSASALVSEGYTRTGLGQYVAPDEDRWSLESLYDMMSRTQGYYARDYSVWLGWNNVCAGLLPVSAPHAYLSSSDQRSAIS